MTSRAATRDATLPLASRVAPAALEVVEFVITCSHGHPRRRVDRVTVGFRDAIAVGLMLGLPATARASVRLFTGCGCKRPFAAGPHSHIAWQPAACPCGRRAPARSLDGVTAQLAVALQAGQRRVVEAL